MSHMGHAASSNNLRGAALNIVALLLAIPIATFWGTYDQYNLVAVGCDNFGYARQAKLFRDHGLVEGLDTSIHESQSDLLVFLAEKTLGSRSVWYESVAPHCHHYNVRSGKIILQYPPGSGLLLSLFPETVALPYLLVTGSFLASGVLLWLCIGRRLSPHSVIVIAGATVTLFWAISQRDTLASASIPITMILLPPLAVLTTTYPGKSFTVAGIFGLMCGLLIAIRISNVLLVAGLALQCIITSKLWRRSNMIASWHRIAVSCAAFLAGIAPLLLANKINAAGWLYTTYSSIDASEPIWQWEQIRDGFVYYFNNPLDRPLLVIAASTLLVGTLAWATHPNSYTPAATIGAFLLLLLSLIFFTTHSVRIPYYIVPSCILVVLMIAVEIAYRERKLSSKWTWPALVPLVIFGALRLYLITPSHVTVKVPDEVMAPSAIVWADITGGTLYYYAGRYTSKLSFTDRDTQDKLVEAVRQAGRVQYLIIDSPQMQETCDRLAALHGVTYVGSIEAFGTRKVLRIDPHKTGLLRLCPPP